jgi:diguanylate cyclase (GGDEF)-like protein
MVRKYLTLLDLYKETFIPNTHCLKDILKKVFYFHERKGREFSLMLVDIDNLRQINKEKGYFVGNRVLLLVADTIDNSIRKSDIAGKYKSGSFLIILPETDEEGAKVVSERLAKRLADIQVEGYSVSATITLCSYPKDGELPEKLLNFLEEQTAKAKGKNKPIITVESFRKQKISCANSVTAGNLISAIEEDRVVPAFQPILNLKKDSIEGYEVLTRIEDQGDYIPAMAFIDQIYELSFLTVFEEIIFDKAINAWLAGKVRGKLFFNMPSYFVNYLAKGKVKLEDFKKELTKAGIPAKDVVIEIPESKITATTEELIEVVNNIKALDFKVAVDDFGVENSSIERLFETRPDIVKIDGFFLKEERDVLRWIVKGLKRLDYAVAIEHVEKAEDLELVKKLGADYAQGFYIGKPEVLA